MNYEILNGLPKSHRWERMPVNGGSEYKGIMWDSRDIRSSDTLFLYRDWANTFFDSNWYEIGTGSISSADSTDRDVTLLGDMLGNRLTPGKTLIDVHCGSGRHLLKLAEQGINGVGMERADLLRDQAVQKIEESGLSIIMASTDQADKERFKGKADIVTTLFNSMGLHI